MMEEKRTCPICGNPTRSYMGNYRKDGLCGKHADLLKAGKIHFSNDIWVNENGMPLANKAESDVTSINEPSIKLEEGICKCIACGKETKPGYLFCASCYHKYKDKKLLVQIDKCSKITLMDESYENDYKCDDGHMVKSRGEVIIDNYLLHQNITHVYEATLPISNDSADDLHPDFYLPNFKKNISGEVGDVYIELFGFGEDNASYTKKKQYKLQKYKELGTTVICVNNDDLNDINGALNRKLNFLNGIRLINKLATINKNKGLRNG